MIKKFYVLFFVLAGLFSTKAQAQFVSQEAEMQARGSNLFVEEQEVVMPEPVQPVEPKVAPYRYDTNVKIAFIVNGEMVTTDDINNRVKAFSLTTRIPVNSETKEMIFSKITQNTIDEKIKIQEAQKEKINISEKEVDEAVEGFAQSNGMTKVQFEQELRKNGINVNALRDQMKSDLAWVRLVRSKSYGEVEVNQKDIEKAIAYAKKDMTVKKFRLSEIIVSKKNNKNISDLVHALRQDPRFELYAMQFSEAPTASSGGSLGWVDREKLFPVLARKVSEMREGEISDPIEVGNDYYILKLEKIYDPEKDKQALPSEEEVKKALEGQRLEEFASSYLNKLRQKSIVEMKN
ncbi:MAG: peptidylprolyl isomerase [Alphaproteobacteria bacterium]|nr:peptidylprolyl isomerase [Alphaproteobacteria bacterium]